MSINRVNAKHVAAVVERGLLPRLRRTTLVGSNDSFKVPLSNAPAWMFNTFFSGRVSRILASFCSDQASVESRSNARFKPSCCDDRNDDIALLGGMYFIKGMPLGVTVSFFSTIT